MSHDKSGHRGEDGPCSPVVSKWRSHRDRMKSRLSATKPHPEELELGDSGRLGNAYHGIENALEVIHASVAQGGTKCLGATVVTTPLRKKSKSPVKETLEAMDSI